MCEHEEVSLPTSGDPDAVCAACGDVVTPQPKYLLEFTTRKTPHGCHVTKRVVNQRGEHLRGKTFRNGYADATVSARQWILSQCDNLTDEAAMGNVTMPQITIDGKPYVDCRPPRLSEAVASLSVLVKHIRDREEMPASLVSLLPMADAVIEKYERSLQRG
jgi:hypothetical protein